MESSVEKKLQTINILIDRLERLSADSILAHQASGLRGSLLHARKHLLGEQPVSAPENVNEIILQGFEILARAAGEIPGDGE